MKRCMALALAALLLPARAFAHSGRPIEPHDLWSAWSFEPVTIALLALSLALYAIGTRRVWRAAGSGHGVRRAEAWSFAAGWLVLALALLSPLHALGGALFSAHMAQHELLMVVAAPLLVLGRPLVAMAWGLPRGWRAGVGRAMHARPVRSAWHALSAPLVAWGIHGTAIWLWHAPRLFEATERSEAVHALEHASFLLTALLFWWAVLHHRRRAASDGAAIALLVATMMHTSVLGALITFAPGLWYRSYVATTAAWGFLPLEDQQLAGLIMWIPGGISYLVAALALFARMLRGERTEPSTTRALLRPSTSSRTTP